MTVGKSQVLENETCKSSSKHRRQPVNPRRGQERSALAGEALSNHESSSNGRVEGATGDTADGGGTSEDDHADAEAVEEVGALARVGDVEDDEGQSEGEDEFGEEGTAHELRSRADGVRVGDVGAALEKHGDEAGAEGTTALAEQVAGELEALVLLGEPDGECDGGVEVAAGDVAEGEDHCHEHEANGDEVDVGFGMSGNDVVVHVDEGDGEHEEEGAEGLGQVVGEEGVERYEVGNADVFVDDVEGLADDDDGNCNEGGGDSFYLRDLVLWCWCRCAFANFRWLISHLFRFVFLNLRNI